MDRTCFWRIMLASASIFERNDFPSPSASRPKKLTILAPRPTVTQAQKKAAEQNKGKKSDGKRVGQWTAPVSGA
jgi:hypothetical protein